MKVSWIAAAAMAVGSLALVACSEDTPNATEPSGPAATQVPAPDGRIVFARADPSAGVLAGDSDTYTYTVNADGSDEQPLFSEGPSAGPRWSPDGTEIHIFCCGDGMAAHIVDPETGVIRTSFPPPDPTLETYCGGAWSPDGERLACGAFGVDDPSRNGIYSVRASDGGGLSRITTNPGGEDAAGDYSPEGDRLVFVRIPKDGRVGVYVTDLKRGDIHRISPRGVVVDDIFGGSWSPTGDRILFVARDTEQHHKAIWVVNADGSSPHPLSIAPGCGGPLSDPESFGCYSPSWSPDGQWIVFVRSAPDGSEENLWIVNADGSGLVPLTDGGFDDQPDWGPDPAA
jgi:Tol biopolymer transport system component